MFLGAVGKKCRVLSAVPLGALFPSAPTDECIVRKCTSNSAPFVVSLSSETDEEMTAFLAYDSAVDDGVMVGDRTNSLSLPPPMD